MAGPTVPTAHERRAIQSTRHKPQHLAKRGEPCLLIVGYCCGWSDDENLPHVYRFLVVRNVCRPGHYISALSCPCPWLVLQRKRHATRGQLCGCLVCCQPTIAMHAQPLSNLGQLDLLPKKESARGWRYDVKCGRTLLEKAVQFSHTRQNDNSIPTV